MLAMAAAGMAAGPALAEELAPLDTGPGVETCGGYMKLDTEAQIAALGAIQPLGDEIGNDAEADRQWAAEVAEACGEDADRPLEDAAAAALDQE